MTEPQHINTIMGAISAPCPYCHAQPYTPCVNGTRTLRYTHAERNR